MRILVCGPTFEYVRDRMWTHLAHTVPFAHIDWMPGICGLPAFVRHGTDEYIFLSFECGKEKFQGLTFDFVMLSEPIPKELAPYVFTRIRT